MTAPPRHKPPADPQYRADYERGWRYSQRETATLDHLDAKRAPDAEYDGYIDFACGREKWHLPNCPDHDHVCNGGPAR